jgi:hypothetical protein
MKIAYSCFEKRHGTHEKKNIFKNRIETDVTNKKNLMGPTNSVLQIWKQFVFSHKYNHEVTSCY